MLQSSPSAWQEQRDPLGRYNQRQITGERPLGF